MKTLGNILKVLAALAAVAGVVYVIAKYGDKIVAWAKGLLCKCGLCSCGECCDCCEEVEEVPAAEEASAEETPIEEGEVQAEENDFEG